MPLTDIIAKLDNLIVARREPHEIKPLLLTLHDQAEALDLRVAELEFEAKNSSPNSVVESLKSELQLARLQNHELQQEILDLRKQQAKSKKTTALPSGQLHGLRRRSGS